MKLNNLLLLIFSFLFINWAHAGEIVEVKKNIQLGDTDPVYIDYIISPTEGLNLKKNLVVKAIRQINIKNSAQKTLGQIKSQIGLLKIIHIEGNIAVAREFELTERASEVVLEQPYLMIGDQIDSSGSFIDNKAKK